MEDFILKGIELGALGLVTVLLLTRGLAALTALTAAIDKLADKINSMDLRVEKIERDISGIKDQLAEIKFLFTNKR